MVFFFIKLHWVSATHVMCFETVKHVIWLEHKVWIWIYKNANKKRLTNKNLDFGDNFHKIGVIFSSFQSFIELGHPSEVFLTSKYVTLVRTQGVWLHLQKMLPTNANKRKNINFSACFCRLGVIFSSFRVLLCCCHPCDTF